MKRLLPIAILFLGFTAPLYLVRDANAAEDAGVVAGSGSAAGSAAAPAITVVVPDPATDPLGDAKAVTSLWKSGAILPAVIVAAFTALTLLSKYVPKLKVGKTAAYVAAGIGLLAACIPAASQGQTPTLAALLAAVGAAVALILHPAPTDATKS